MVVHWSYRHTSFRERERVLRFRHVIPDQISTIIFGQWKYWFTTANYPFPLFYPDLGQCAFQVQLLWAFSWQGNTNAYIPPKSVFIIKMMGDERLYGATDYRSELLNSPNWNRMAYSTLEDHSGIYMILIPSCVSLTLSALLKKTDHQNKFCDWHSFTDSHESKIDLG